MKRFFLQRKHDVSGVSGVGNIAEGVLFDDGQIALLWLSDRASVGIYKTLEDVVHIHGHEGNTEVVWIDNASSNVVVENDGCKCEIDGTFAQALKQQMSVVSEYQIVEIA